jgi:hypothetical protein
MQEGFGECWWRGLYQGWVGRSVQVLGRCFSLFCWENGLSSNTDSNRICCADFTTPTLCRRAGPAASTVTDYRNGYRPGGSTANSDPKSTHASDASTPNATQNIDGVDDHPTPREGSEC